MQSFEICGRPERGTLKKQRPIAPKALLAKPSGGFISTACVALGIASHAFTLRSRALGGSIGLILVPRFAGKTLSISQGASTTLPPRETYRGRPAESSGILRASGLPSRRSRLRTADSKRVDSLGMSKTTEAGLGS